MDKITNKPIGRSGEYIIGYNHEMIVGMAVDALSYEFPINAKYSNPIYNLKTIQYSEVPVGGLFLYKVFERDVYILLRKSESLSGRVIWTSRDYSFHKGETMPLLSKLPVAYMGVILKGEYR